LNGLAGQTGNSGSKGSRGPSGAPGLQGPPGPQVEYNPGLSIRGGTRYFYPPKMVFGTS
jgi:hypothetical protein